MRSWASQDGLVDLRASSSLGGAGVQGYRDAWEVRVVTGQGEGASGERCNLAAPCSYPLDHPEIRSLLPSLVIFPLAFATC